MTISAKVIVQNSRPMSPYDTSAAQSLTLVADYNDDSNKKWAYYTPALTINMTVRGELADQFPIGRKFTLKFEEEPNRTDSDSPTWNYDGHADGMPGD